MSPCCLLGTVRRKATGSKRRTDVNTTQVAYLAIRALSSGDVAEVLSKRSIMRSSDFTCQSGKHTQSSRLNLNAPCDAASEGYRSVDRSSSAR